jgi:NAD(P)-dependent dehydrogenase (short-subunit alcohol dehydrogenase family)
VAAEIGGKAIACDVSNAAAAEAALAEAAEAFGEARILINCAGIAPAVRVAGRDGPHDLDLFRKVIEVNLVGSFNMLRLFADRASKLEPLADGERGVVISTASVAAFDGQIGQAAYSASKGGVHAMALPIARELARFGIRIMTIAPGIFATPMLLGMPQEVQDSLGASVPVPVPPRTARGICQPGHAHHRQRHAQRRDDPPRRRNPDGAQVREIRWR